MPNGLEIIRGGAEGYGSLRRCRFAGSGHTARVAATVLASGMTTILGGSGKSDFSLVRASKHDGSGLGGRSSGKLDGGGIGRATKKAGAGRGRSTLLRRGRWAAPSDLYFLTNTHSQAEAVALSDPFASSALDLRQNMTAPASDVGQKLAAVASDVGKK